jgi:hypothetical protein
MGYMKKYKCPICFSTKFVIRKTKRNKSLLFFAKYDWVLLWGVDYKRNDIPVISISPAESYQAWSKYFLYFRILNHYPSLIVCDDNINLKTAA